MAALHLTAPDALLNSPGSSVFDLPTQPLQPSYIHPHSRLVNSHMSDTPEDRSFIIISGGTGCNAICAAFSQACYVLPVSDDGGSSSEIIRVLGGPSIGL